MIARSLLDQLQQLSREERLDVIRYLSEEASDDINAFPKGARIFKTWPTIAPPEAVAMLEQLENESRDSG